MPKLSIVTVVKDDTPGWIRTRSSLHHQHSTDWEWIVVDGSRSPLAAEHALGVPVTVIREQPRGIYPAMNTGLAAAAGEYILFLNAGDTLADSEVITRIVSGFAISPAPMWAFGRVAFTSESGSRLRERPWEYREEREHLFARGVFPAHQGLVARTSILRDLGGFDTSYRIAADYALMLKLSVRYEPVRWAWTLANFQQGGASTQHWWLAQQEFHRARREVFQPEAIARVREIGHTVKGSVRAALGKALSSMRR